MRQIPINAPVPILYAFKHTKLYALPLLDNPLLLFLSLSSRRGNLHNLFHSFPVSFLLPAFMAQHDFSKNYTCAADRHGSTQTLLHLSFWCACATVNNLEKISITCPSTFPHPTEHWVWCIANERFSEGEDYVMYGPDWFLVDKINECIPKAFLFFKYSFYQRNILNMARNSKVRKFQLL